MRVCDSKVCLPAERTLCCVMSVIFLLKNGPEVLWECTKDLLKTQSASEERRVVLRFLHCLIEGQVSWSLLVRYEYNDASVNAHDMSELLVSREKVLIYICSVSISSVYLSTFHVILFFATVSLHFQTIVTCRSNACGEKTVMSFDNCYVQFLSQQRMTKWERVWWLVSGFTLVGLQSLVIPLCSLIRPVIGHCVYHWAIKTPY